MQLIEAVTSFRNALANQRPYEFEALLAASKHASNAERDEAVRALLAEGFDHPERTGLLCVAAGALVEDGASPTIGASTILDRLADGAEILAASTLEGARLDEMLEPPPAALPELERRWIAGWKNHVRGAMARLARDVTVRRQLREHARLVAALRVLVERTDANHVRYLAEQLDMLDGEPLHVIDLTNNGTLSRYRAFGIRSGFHLMTVLEGHRPFELCMQGAESVTAKLGYYTWPGLEETSRGFEVTDLMAMLWGEPPAISLPRYEGVVTIVKTRATMARSWDTHFLAPLHEAMPEQLVLETALSAAESLPILRRIAARARE